MIGALKGLLGKVRPDTKVSALSAAPVALALLLHGVHLLLLPAAAAAEMEEHMHHGAMAGATSHVGMAHEYGGAMPWLTVLAVALNIFGSYYAVRMLWRVWKTKRRDRHAFVCCAVAVVSLAVGIGSTGMMA